MADTFKVGDHIKVVVGSRSNYACDKAVVLEVRTDGALCYQALSGPNEGMLNICNNENCKLIKKSMSSVKDKFVLVFKKEPEKFFIKAGIMGTDETLTEEGQEIFLTWLLKENGAAFKKEVVDPILAEEEKD